MKTMSLFEEADIEVREPDPMTTVRVGNRVAQIPLHKRRREACNKLMEMLQQLEGEDIHIGLHDAGGRHYWVQSLKLPRLKLDWYPRLNTARAIFPASLSSGEAGQLRSGYSQTTW